MAVTIRDREEMKELYLKAGLTEPEIELAMKQEISEEAARRVASYLVAAETAKKEQEKQERKQEILKSMEAVLLAAADKIEESVRLDEREEKRIASLEKMEAERRRKQRLKAYVKPTSIAMNGKRPPICRVVQRILPIRPRKRNPGQEV